MRVYNSFPDYCSLTEHLNTAYGLKLDEIHLYRDMIGAVYFLREKDRRLVYKLYRTFDTKAAIQATQIIAYLKSNNFPVVAIIPTKGADLYSTIAMPEGERVGILFEYVEGKEPEVKEDIVLIGKLTGQMHKLMESYPGVLRELGKEHYIDRFIATMRERFSEAEKIEAMDRYADELWSNLLYLPKGFSHGDLHTGNLLKTRDGEIVFMDFDIASYSYPMFDVATICDDTDFCLVEEKDLEQTYRNFERFYAGYSIERQLSCAEKAAIFDCIAIHHYELNGTIPMYRLPLEGDHWLNERYFNLHYRWVMDWKEARKDFGG